jgi:hypothetical protein
MMSFRRNGAGAHDRVLQFDVVPARSETDAYAETEVFGPVLVPPPDECPVTKPSGDGVFASLDEKPLSSRSALMEFKQAEARQAGMGDAPLSEPSLPMIGAGVGVTGLSRWAMRGVATFALAAVGFVIAGAWSKHTSAAKSPELMAREPRALETRTRLHLLGAPRAWDMADDFEEEQGDESTELEFEATNTPHGSPATTPKRPVTVPKAKPVVAKPTAKPLRASQAHGGAVRRPGGAHGSAHWRAFVRS